VTDNGGNCVSAIDEDNPGSFQALKDKRVIHMRCGIHSLFLVKGDMKARQTCLHSR
jgi:hypothetical protein